jgi:hypothetical protein
MSDLLDFALHAHGGLERWREVQRLDMRVSLTGGLYRLKGYPEGVPNVNMTIDARRPFVTITPYARPDHRGYFTPDRVWIQDRTSHIVDERNDPRASFAGHVLETKRRASELLGVILRPLRLFQHQIEQKRPESRFYRGSPGAYL